MTQHSPEHPSIRPPHPLAVALIDRLRGRGGMSVLEIGRGSGRNTRALEAAGFRVVTLDDAVVADGALSTHALLHGTVDAIGGLLNAIAERTQPGAPLAATFGSQRDARFGIGTPVAPETFAPESGDERGVPHSFFTRASLHETLADRWNVESMEELEVDEIAGSWAHEKQPLRGAVHWFVWAVRR